MASLNKTLMILFLSAVFSILMLGVLNCPCDKTDERTKCRKEIALIRDFLRNNNSHMELNFMGWRTNVCINSNMSTAEQMGRYCWIVCERTGTTFLNFSIRDGYTLLIDPWGECYNIAKTNELDILKKSKYVSGWNVGPYMIWSSGPNRKNEHGDGDDIVGLRKN